MNDEEFHIGQTVHVIGGEYKGHSGKVYYVSNDPYSYVNVNIFGGKSISKEHVSATEPSSVPLPPNFLPNKFKVGDRVETVHFRREFNAITGRIVKTPTSTDRLALYEDRAYHITVIHDPRGNYSPGYLLHYPEDALKESSDPLRVEGEEVAYEDIQIGDVIRVSIESKFDGYSQGSHKEGRVTNLTKKTCSYETIPNHETYTFYNTTNGIGRSLNYNAEHEKITLVKKAENPWVEVLKGLTAGTVVVYEREPGRIYTFVKSADGFGSLTKDNWHEINNGISASSTKVTEDVVLRALDDGAEIVHKVRKAA